MSEYISEMFTCFGLNLQVYMKINYFKGKNMNLLFNMFPRCRTIASCGRTKLQLY